MVRMEVKGLVPAKCRQEMKGEDASGGEISSKRWQNCGMSARATLSFLVFESTTESKILK